MSYTKIDPYTRMPVADNQQAPERKTMPLTELKYMTVNMEAGAHPDFVHSAVKPFGTYMEAENVKQWGCWIDDLRINSYAIVRVSWRGKDGLMWILWEPRLTLPEVTQEKDREWPTSINPATSG